MKYTKQRGLSLVMVSFVSMLVAALGMTFLYYVRYGHLPMPDLWARWGKSANVIGNDLKNAAGLPVGNNQGPGMREAATTSEGIRRCTIDGKTVYSDTLCLDNNPSTKKIKLADSKGVDPVKAAVLNDDGNKATNGTTGTAPQTDEEVKRKIMEQALGKGATASTAAENDLHMKATNRAIDRATR
ncbi:hypothetical protein ACO0LF_13835 [Undibacterium sp. Di27W]|uniref:hypothetical protein n=1 Tax=Undibacterium sp. Di27W TaxID=3413036 RepID=UPI003BF0DAA9